ncbi:MAG: hypothetical protein IPN01_31990 [Deltaproteobacteria bacterium]|nr:hypothetical protein [Deltaproteobacteria bacterium]
MPPELGEPEHNERAAHALALELAELGYVPSYALLTRLGRMPLAQLTALHGWLPKALAKAKGAHVNHTPLYRRFPDGVPNDTLALWIQRMLVHYLQREGLPCITCGGVGSTHVLRPCHHVVCERCFDITATAGCPVCGTKLIEGSRFFTADEAPRPLSPNERWIKLQVLHPSAEEPAARALLERLCARAQAMSPDDVAALKLLVAEKGLTLLAWLPEQIPVKENLAIVLGGLLKAHPNDTAVHAQLSARLKTATDVLRVIAVLSGADVSLQAKTKLVPVKHGDRRWDKKTLDNKRGVAYQPISSARFVVAKMGRPIRRALLGLLNALPEATLAEDLHRHKSLWRGVGERLHPYELAERFPVIARAFVTLRGTTGPLADALIGTSDTVHRDAKGRPALSTFRGVAERLLRAKDVAGLTAHLRARPGELARRLDLLLRLDPTSRAPDEAILAVAERLTTPMLLTLTTALARRHEAGPDRVFFPATPLFNAPSAKDTRPLLSAERVGPIIEGLERTLLTRLARLDPVQDAVIDESLAQIIVPFNERTASVSAVNLPRGSSLALPEGPLLRLFMHWCQPPKDESYTDLDLSVGFYGDDWGYRDVCAYYHLKLSAGGVTVARSSGDFTSAPHPDGASEFVDLLLKNARSQGYRFAVMVVNAYSGLPFSKLERAFAGLMVREDEDNAIFDPRTVRLRFALDGPNGVFMPLVVDLATRRLHWLDVSRKGQLAMNNVATSTKDIQSVCPRLLHYFEHGSRPTMFRLAALHAAARAQRVLVRSPWATSELTRRPGEDAHGLFRRVLHAQADTLYEALPPLEGPVFAALSEGDLTLPEGAEVYALFREAVAAPRSAADLLSAPPG